MLSLPKEKVVGDWWKNHPSYASWKTIKMARIVHSFKPCISCLDKKVRFDPKSVLTDRVILSDHRLLHSWMSDFAKTDVRHFVENAVGPMPLP